MAGPLILCSLGGLTFGLSTAAYQRMTRDTAHRWPQADRIGRAPALQYVGPGGETIELSGVIHPHFRGGLGQIDRMRALAGQGTPLRLVSGEGRVMGAWCILSIRERQSDFLPGGAPRAMHFDLSLARFGEDA